MHHERQSVAEEPLEIFWSASAFTFFFVHTMAYVHDAIKTLFIENAFKKRKPLCDKKGIIYDHTYFYAFLP